MFECFSNFIKSQIVILFCFGCFFTSCKKAEYTPYKIPSKEYQDDRIDFHIWVDGVGTSSESLKTEDFEHLLSISKSEPLKDNNPYHNTNSKQEYYALSFFKHYGADRKIDVIEVRLRNESYKSKLFITAESFRPKEDTFPKYTKANLNIGSDLHTIHLKCHDSSCKTLSFCIPETRKNKHSKDRACFKSYVMSEISTVSKTNELTEYYRLKVTVPAISLNDGEPVWSMTFDSEGLEISNPLESDQCQEPQICKFAL